jgi:hypothetical protein
VNGLHGGGNAVQNLASRLDLINAVLAAAPNCFLIA